MTPDVIAGTVALWDRPNTCDVKELAHDLNTPIVDVVETLINFAISQVEIVVEYEDD